MYSQIDLLIANTQSLKYYTLQDFSLILQKLNEIYEKDIIKFAATLKKNERKAYLELLDIQADEGDRISFNFSAQMRSTQMSLKTLNTNKNNKTDNNYYSINNADLSPNSSKRGRTELFDFDKAEQNKNLTKMLLNDNYTKQYPSCEIYDAQLEEKQFNSFDLSQNAVETYQEVAIEDLCIPIREQQDGKQFILSTLEI
ncbi:UNKNOWN [Stylonychia lemnae]|uniref:Uncharacterized protein n=1 Tax=Stylonychia lemnae TaxID=5949 RepID=A0A077ZXV2_STYLE|nr:UNKNOWN [Stylonychia lemnae]|eukprot:CDW74417.1 UNKNOWN [Stylonychia lemnae]